MTTLNDLKIGQKALITDILDTDIATQAFRLGISVGEMVCCLARVPAGPVVIQRGGMELALGEALCYQIEIELQ
jgi:Fe2+ transport system protein FeoA